MSDSVALAALRPVHEVPKNLAFADPGAAMAQLSRYAADSQRLYREREAALRQTEQAQVNSLTLLSRAAEYRDDETGAHMDRVGALSALLAKLTGHSAEEVRMIRLAAPMHDIGKIATPDSVLKKPGGYTIAERRIMNNHTRFGAEILGQSDIPLLRMAAAVALTHHECWDGSGYPRQLRGDEIPWCGRIVTMIDFFDALTMDRVYRPAVSDEMTRQMLQKERARKFDPEMLDVFVNQIDRFIQLRDDINAGVRDHAALLHPQAQRLAVEMGL